MNIATFHEFLGGAHIPISIHRTCARFPVRNQRLTVAMGDRGMDWTNPQLKQQEGLSKTEDERSKAAESFKQGLETEKTAVLDILSHAKEVPPEFVVGEEVQSTLRRSGDEEEDDSLQLPVIDLSALMEFSAADEGARERVKAEIGRACEEWGFFLALKHGIPESLVESTLGVVGEFFDLPIEEKLKYAMNADRPMGYGKKIYTKNRLWGDAFMHLMRPLPPPFIDVRPTTPANYRDVMAQYCDEVVKLVRTLTPVLSEYVGLESTALGNSLTLEKDAFPAIAVNCNLYPKCPQPDHVLGLFPHSDAGVMTVLCQNHAGPGLQVLKGEKWVNVKPRKNALVINVGDQLEILTNGRFKSSQHRAVANSSSTRLSIASFCGPGSLDMLIGPLSQFVDAKDPSTCRYPTMSYSDYLARYMSRDMETKPFTSMESVIVSLPAGGAQPV